MDRDESVCEDVMVVAHVPRALALERSELAVMHALAQIMDTAVRTTVFGSIDAAARERIVCWFHAKYGVPNVRRN